MKNFLLLFFLCSLSLFSKSQVVTGVYKGKMVSDSLKYTVDFELTLKEKNGELYGYCQRLFLIDDVLYYNLVKVKARIKDSVLIVEDEKSVSNNFKEKTKGIKTVYMFNVKDIVDTASVLNGEWSTSAWRNNYALPGSLIVNRERNYLATQLYKRLEEKQLSKEMLFDEPKPVYVSTPTKPQPTDVVTTQPNNKPTATTTTQNKPEVVAIKDSAVNTVANNKPQQTDIVTSQTGSTPIVTNTTQNKPSNTQTKDSTANTIAINKPQETKPKPTDVALNQNKPAGSTTLQTKPVATTAKDSVNKTSVAVTNPQQSTTKPNTTAGNQTVTASQNSSAVNNTNKPNSTAANNSVATQQQNKPVTTKDSTTKTSVAVNNPQQTNPKQQPVTTSKPVVNTPAQNQPSTANNNKPITQQQTGSVASNTKPTNSNSGTNTQPQNTAATTNKPAEQKPTTTSVTAPVTNNQQESGISSIGNIASGNTTAKPQIGDGKPPVINNPVIVKRQVEIIEALEVSEDSVVLSLYDNGEIDGDTVSVFLNNELIVPKVGIKASAYKKTIAVKKGEVIQLTLFAENLGSIPPNTGLLIVTTGNERYLVNFTSTLNKSSSIVLKRKE
jgi:hypothetical protein